MPYTIEEHTHRLAAWDAATSARASILCRFKVKTGVEILEACGFTAQFSIDQLPDPDRVDEVHREWRKKVITEARNRKYTFTDGIAAKLINSYLKARFVCGGYHENERVACIHPPIDSILMESLSDINIGGKQDEWRRMSKKKWSKFKSQDYEKVILLIRQTIPGQPLWKIEEFWRGYQ